MSEAKRVKSEAKEAKLVRENAMLKAENERLKRARREDASAPPAPPLPLNSAVDALRRFFRTTQIPSKPERYQIPNLTLPRDNPSHRSVRDAGVKIDWSQPDTPRPDFLVTRLKERVIRLTEFSWKGSVSQLTCKDGEVNLDLGTSTSSHTALVAASGAGKTRFLCEQGYVSFGAYVTARTDVSTPMGSSDMGLFLSSLPQELSDGVVEEWRAKLTDRMRRIAFVRAVALQVLRDKCPDLKPMHWLNAQLFPERIFGGDIFVQALEKIHEFDVSGDSMLSQWQASGMRFIAIDEAQRADNRLPDTFPNEKRTAKPSALAVLVAEVALLKTNVIISGTGLGIKSAFELIASSAAKHHLEPRLVGTTTMMDEKGLRQLIKKCGYYETDSVKVQTLRRFAGRPRFGTRLAEALIMRKSLKDVEESIVRGFQNVLVERCKERPASSSPSSGKTLYEELRCAATQWVVRGKGAISCYGEKALEVGVGALRPLGPRKGRTLAFVLEEPLVVRAFNDVPSVEFENLTNESAETIGVMFEDYVALHAQEIVNFLSGSELEVDRRQVKPWRGPWKLAAPGSNCRRGISLRGSGDEPTKIRHILKCAGTRGESLLFPGVMMGADVVISAARENDPTSKLLAFVQVKARTKTTSEQAMKSLELPFHKNRKRKPSVPDKYKAALQHLDAIMASPDVAVMFLVFKYPADSVRGYDHVVVGDYKGKSVLKVVMDSTMVDQRKCLKGMEVGLRAMREVKDRMPHLFTE